MSTYRALFDRQREYFLSDVTKSYEWRIEQLNRLERLVSENQQAFNEALGTDFKTAWFERNMEYYGILGSIADTKARLKGWMEPEEAPLSKLFTESGHKGMVYREPYGVCLIIAPFNAPITLTLEPLITAISAGNTAVIKPAETTAHMAALFEDLIGRYFEPDAVAIVRGDRTVITELLTFPFDFLFFTGSTNVGKVIMRAAAENLTPVLLELGGQNPSVVDQTANLVDAAEKLVWGSMAFGGQWCVSPGYVYVHEAVASEFVEACKTAIHTLYGSDPKQSPDFSRIVSERDVDRIANMLKGANVVAGGGYDRATRYVEPTLVYPAAWSDAIMETEIFGPVLPILTYTDLGEVVKTIKRKPKSLAGYIFSRDQANIDLFVHSLSFGGGAVNQTMLQCFMTSSMPFGGVGPSGLGRYYGKYGFDSMSHAKSVIVSPADVKVDAVLPPYTEEKAMALGAWFTVENPDRSPKVA